MNSKNLMSGLSAGAAVGVEIGMLLAQANENITEARLKKGSEKLVKDLKGTAEESPESDKIVMTTMANPSQPQIMLQSSFENHRRIFAHLEAIEKYLVASCLPGQ